MAPPTPVYTFGPFRVTDDMNDKFLYPTEVTIKVDKPAPGQSPYRPLTDKEWGKFMAIPQVRQRKLIPLAPPILTGENILYALRTHPAALQPIIEAMGGVGYVVLALEAHLGQHPQPETLAQAQQKLRQSERDFVAYYEQVKAAPTNVFIPGFIPHIFFHGDATETWMAWVPEAKRTGDPRQDASLAIEEMASRPQALEVLKKVIAIGSFVFGKMQLQYDLEKTLGDALTNGKCDCDKFAALYAHYGRLIGLEVKLYKFNNHVAVIVDNPSLPGGRVVVESTSGIVVDPTFYYRVDPPIASLHVGFPLAIFESPSSGVVASVLVQEINDLMEAGKAREAVPFFELLEKIEPRNPNVLVLGQILYAEIGDAKKTEACRLKAVHLLPKPPKTSP